MDLNLTEEQVQLVAAFRDLYDDLSTVEVVQRAERGHDAQLWQRLQATGAVEMAVTEAAGGHGATLLDLELVAEQHGRYVAPAPLVEAQVTARLLERLSDDKAAAALQHAVSGEQLVTLAVRPATSGRAELVPAGAVADAAIVLIDDSLHLVPIGGSTSYVENLGQAPLADIDIEGLGADTAIARGADAIAAYARALDEWRVLTAGALSGLAQCALEIVVGYVKERQAFGQPLGAFQGIAHRLADRAAEVEGSLLLAREAAWAAEEEPGRAAELAALALGFAADTARDTSYFALHFHGGYGFMLEYPLHLYYRRARAWAAVLESPADSYRHAAGATLAVSA